MTRWLRHQWRLNLPLIKLARPSGIDPLSHPLQGYANPSQLEAGDKLFLLNDNLDKPIQDL